MGFKVYPSPVNLEHSKLDGSTVNPIILHRDSLHESDGTYKGIGEEKAVAGEGLGLTSTTGQEERLGAEVHLNAYAVLCVMKDSLDCTVSTEYRQTFSVPVFDIKWTLKCKLEGGAFDGL